MTREIDRREARQGETPGVTRYVLGTSLTLTVLTLGSAYVWFF